ncbi:Uncharacterized protein FKW44_018243 [Caligus rogercresseyi]|uniref:Uncharacterized protein n=1 Tax=Caligus rogercresseyi TaxID=217165 RepID=A0A7T8GUP3_CALRO|nr:Uncharacterized protein FKW44_018243 [Caligus rogercresseyi]
MRDLIIQLSSLVLSIRPSGFNISSTGADSRKAVKASKGKMEGIKPHQWMGISPSLLEHE